MLSHEQIETIVYAFIGNEVIDFGQMTYKGETFIFIYYVYNTNGQKHFISYKLDKE